MDDVHARPWPDAEDSALALQEWFGYVISGRLDMHKILLLVGPTRAGKGVTSLDELVEIYLERHAAVVR